MLSASARGSDARCAGEVLLPSQLREREDDAGAQLRLPCAALPAERRG